MADDKKNPDEYEYPSDEYFKGGEYTPPSDTEPLETGDEPRASHLSRKVLSILGVLLAVGIVYLILLYINHKRNVDLSQPGPTAEVGSATIPGAMNAAQISSTTMPQTQQSQPQTIQTMPATQVTVNRGVDQATLQNLNNQNQVNQQSMAQLQSQMQQLQSQVNTVTNSISQLNSQLLIIANEIRAIAVDRGLGGRNISMVKTGKTYEIKALIPGRAWLQARDGSTTTVTIGDRLPGYGIIQMINTHQGVVTTSSGAIIQYGQRDS